MFNSLEADAEEILRDLLDNGDLGTAGRVSRAVAYPPTPPDDDDEDPSDKKKTAETHSQWAIGGNGRFVPVGSTVGRLQAGIYEPFAVGSTLGLEQVSVSSDSIYKLPDMATEEVLTEIQQFWSSEDRYRKHQLLYKRGLLLWGPPGSGKTITVKLLMQELVQRDGLVILVGNVNLAIAVLKALRRIEPVRNLIVVLEDIDEIINYNGEASVLSMLDGENNIDRVLHLATTNYPERLGARIINRPSRFDRRVYVGMPGNDARRVYLEKTTNGDLSEKVLSKWIRDTKDMSIAHLRELVAAVYCLNQPYGEVLERLKAMATPPKGETGFGSSSLGFGAKGA
jgi:hypothetical protein